MTIAYRLQAQCRCGRNIVRGKNLWCKSKKKKRKMREDPDTPQTCLRSSLLILTSNRGQDLAMMALFNSKERTREQWVELIGKADSRFSVKRVTMMSTGPLALIEVIWQ